MSEAFVDGGKEADLLNGGGVAADQVISGEAEVANEAKFEGFEVLDAAPDEVGGFLAGEVGEVALIDERDGCALAGEGGGCNSAVDTAAENQDIKALAVEFVEIGLSELGHTMNPCAMWSEKGEVLLWLGFSKRPSSRMRGGGGGVLRCLVVDPEGGGCASKAIEEVGVIEVLFACLGEGGASFSDLAGADDADVTDSARVLPSSDSRLSVVCGLLGFLGGGFAPTVAFAVLVEPIDGGVGGQFSCAAFAHLGGISSAIHPMGDLCAHRFGDIPREDITIGFSESLAIWGIAAILLDAKLVDHFGITGGVALVRRVGDGGLERTPRVDIADAGVKLFAWDGARLGEAGDPVGAWGFLGAWGSLGGGVVDAGRERERTRDGTSACVGTRIMDTAGGGRWEITAKLGSFVDGRRGRLGKRCGRGGSFEYGGYFCVVQSLFGALCRKRACEGRELVGESRRRVRVDFFQGGGSLNKEKQDVAKDACWEIEKR